MFKDKFIHEREIEGVGLSCFCYMTQSNPTQPNQIKSNQMYCWKLNVATVIVKLEIYLLLIIIYLFMQGWHENFKKICCENASTVKS